MAKKLAHVGRQSNGGRVAIDADRPDAGRILVVDDHAASLTLLSRLLTRDGHAVYRAGSGAV